MLKQNILLLIMIFISVQLYSQTTYKIDNFSEKYVGIVTVDKGYENEIFKKGSISIIDTKTNKSIIKIESDELTFDIEENGKVKTNVLELPYGEQSIIIYQDFNFDGIKDLAVLDGQFSCYHGPSFKIYLETKKGLIYSVAFTQLAQEYCGMFQVNYENKTLYTMTKSGCCWHQFSTFKVVNNIPKPLLIIEEDATKFPYFTSTIIEWNGEKQTEKTVKTLDIDQEGITKVLSFQLLKSKKEVILFNHNDRTLNYVLLTPKETVEFSFPLETVYQNPDFKINKPENLLTFKNENAIYKIYQTETKVGIKVNVNGEIYDLKGDYNTVKGSLKDITKVKLDNVIAE